MVLALMASSPSANDARGPSPLVESGMQINCILPKYSKGGKFISLAASWAGDRN
jgi:hypothetical protein